MLAQTSLYALTVKAMAERLIMRLPDVPEEEIAEMISRLKQSSLSAATIHEFLDRIQQRRRSTRV